MRKFIFTGNFEGSFELIYRDDELVVIDIRQSSLNIKQRRYIYDNAPRSFYVEMLKSFADNTKTHCIEETVTATFSDFWTAYNRKINKKRCEKLWAKLSQFQQLQAVDGIKKYDRHLKLNSWKSKADPEKYLKDEYWENEWR